MMNMEFTNQWKWHDVTYEECCDICRELVIEIDNKRWIVGDYALHIDTHYGDKTMESFARDIGMNRSTVSNWKRVSEFYPQPFRAEQIEKNPNLTYTYFRDALRLGNLELAIEWLQEVSEKGYSADEAARKLTEKLGRETRDKASIEGWVLHEYGTRGDEYVVKICVDKAGLDYLQEVYTVTIKAK